MSTNVPEQKDELKRILDLSDYNLDYSVMDIDFKDLALLAAKIAGTEISLINLIDSYTQWTIANHGLELQQMPREDSVCQYTIAGDAGFEVSDLSKDDRFKDKAYVIDAPKARFYYGIPLKTEEGHNIGALCVLDKEKNNITPEKAELLTIIGEEVVKRLKTYKVIETLRSQVSAVKATQSKVVHDIRGPVAGIIGLAEIVKEEVKNKSLNQVSEFSQMIYESGHSLLEMVNEILSADKKGDNSVANKLNLLQFKEKLENLYVPQAKSKNISFTVTTSAETEKVLFPKNKLLQIAGNLISNAIKFTPEGGTVSTGLQLEDTGRDNLLKMSIHDSGIGISQSGIEAILQGKAVSTEGTIGEQGNGLGLALVKQLIDDLHGSLKIYSLVGAGTMFEVVVPV